MNIETLSLTVKEKIWSVLETVTDPEVPVLTITDLGIVRDVMTNSSSGDGGIEIIITPTYTGCPAMDMIAMNIKLALIENGFKNIKVTYVLSPVWTTDWMSESGKQKLKEYGIAPPNPRQQACLPDRQVRDNDLFAPHEAVQCPHCNSYHTHRISEFGSTACKSLFQCGACREPFDYFKCH